MPERNLLRSAPYFPVGDVDRSATYYQTVLGFDCEYLAGRPARFAIVTRDHLAIMLRRVEEPALVVPNERQGGTWDAFFWVSDVDALNDEMRARGADVVYGPIYQSEYSMREFAVRDADGHVLGFGQDWPAAV